MEAQEHLHTYLSLKAGEALRGDGRRCGPMKAPTWAIAAYPRAGVATGDFFCFPHFCKTLHWGFEPGEVRDHLYLLMSRSKWFIAPPPKGISTVMWAPWKRPQCPGVKSQSGLPPLGPSSPASSPGIVSTAPVLWAHHAQGGSRIVAVVSGIVAPFLLSTSTDSPEQKVPVTSHLQLYTVWT